MTWEFLVGLNTSFDLDFFGRLRNTSETERQNYLATEEAQHTVHILLVSNIAQSYSNQQLVYTQLQIAEETLCNYQRSYAFVGKQLLVGSSNALALEQAREVIESTRSGTAERQGEPAQTNNALWLLLGSYGKLPQAQTVNSDSLQGVKLPVGLLSRILLQRPDIMGVEHMLAVTNTNIDAARAAFPPSISLTSVISIASSDPSSLFNASSGMWNFTPKIGVPIFNVGCNQTNLDIAEVRQQQSVVNYEQKTQNTSKGVAGALALRQSLNDQISAQQRYLASLQITLQRVQVSHQYGAISYLEVPNVEHSLFIIRQTLLGLNYARQVDGISLYIALGGGWQQ